MRTDAARNLDSVLQTGARLWADDPGTSVATIAAEAGVDRRTVYRRFASREALLGAIVTAKLDAIEQVMDTARLDEAPVPVALHRLVEGVITVARRYPIDPATAGCAQYVADRRREQDQHLDAFLRRAAAEGVVRADLPDGLAGQVMYAVVHLFVVGYRDLEPGRAADLAVQILLDGIGAR